MYRISPSAIGMLLECPRCLWLHFREPLKRPQGPFPSLPGGLDETFKKYFDEHRASGALPPEIEGKISGKLFPDRGKLDVWRNNWKGLRAEFPEFGIELKGAIDELLVEDDGRVTPLDFKTRGYPLKEDTHVHYQHQIDLYALLLSRNGMESSGKGYLLFFWPKSYALGAAQFVTELVKLEVSAEKGEEVLSRVAEIIKGDMPEAHSACVFCAYRGNGSSAGETLFS